MSLSQYGALLGLFFNNIKTLAQNCTHIYICKSHLYPAGCTRNEDCQLTEACINNACQHPCAIHNPCAQNAVCINTKHGSDCSCAEGYQGNGYVGCVPGKCIRYLIYIFFVFSPSS